MVPLLTPTSRRHQLEGGTFRLSECLRIKGALTLEGPGTLMIETQGPGLLVEGALTLLDVRIERSGGWGSCIQVAPKARLSVRKGVVTGARSWFDLPEPRPPLPTGVPALSCEIECHGNAELEDVSLVPGGLAGLLVDGNGRVRMTRGEVLGGKTYGVDAGGKSDVSLSHVKLSGQGVACLSASAHAALAAVACCLDDNQSLLNASAHSVVRLTACEALNSRSHGVNLCGEARLFMENCRMSDGQGWGIVARCASHAIVRNCTLRGLGGSGLHVDDRATAELLEGTRLLDIAGTGALVCSTGRLVLHQVSITATQGGVAATDAATVEETEVSITTITGQAPRHAWLLAQWYGASPQSSAIDASEVIRCVWEKLADPDKNADDRRALLDAVTGRAEWAFGVRPWPASMVRLLEIIQAEKEMLVHGGRPAFTAVLLRDEADDELVQLVGLARPPVAFDWQVVQRLAVAPFTAWAVDQNGVAITATPTGQLQRNGVDWLTLKFGRILGLNSAHGQLGVDLEHGIAWLGADGACLGHWSSDSSRDLFDARPVEGDLLTFTLSETSGHPTDRSTRQLRINAGLSVDQATELGISQGQTYRTAAQKWTLPSHEFLSADGCGGVTWNSETGGLLSTWPGPAVSHVAVTATGAIVFALKDGNLWWIRLSKREMDPPKS